MPHSNKISLSQLPANAFATILTLASERLETIRLVSLGLTPGARVAMAQNYGRGPLIVMVRGTRIALGRGEAARIFVQPSLQ